MGQQPTCDVGQEPAAGFLCCETFGDVFRRDQHLQRWWDLKQLLKQRTYFRILQDSQQRRSRQGAESERPRDFSHCRICKNRQKAAMRTLKWSFVGFQSSPAGSVQGLLPRHTQLRTDALVQLGRDCAGRPEPVPQHLLPSLHQLVHQSGPGDRRENQRQQEEVHL